MVFILRASGSEGTSLVSLLRMARNCGVHFLCPIPNVFCSLNMKRAISLTLMCRHLDTDEFLINTNPFMKPRVLHVWIVDANRTRQERNQNIWSSLGGQLCPFETHLTRNRWLWTCCDGSGVVSFLTIFDVVCGCS